MATLYGRLQGNRGEATRCGSSSLNTSAETWSGSVQVHLRRDGDFEVRVGSKHSPYVALTGNVDAADPHQVYLTGPAAYRAAERVVAALTRAGVEVTPDVTAAVTAGLTTDLADETVEVA